MDRGDEKDLELIFYLFFGSFVHYISVIFFPKPQLLPDPTPYTPRSHSLSYKESQTLGSGNVLVSMAGHSGLEINHQNVLLSWLLVTGSLSLS